MAGAGGGGTSVRSLQETPTWALATVCFIFISLSLFIEHLIHLLSHGKTSLISQDGINQLNIFIFVLAVMQIVYSVLTMALEEQRRRWKAWRTRLGQWNIKLLMALHVVCGRHLHALGRAWVTVQIMCSYITLPLYALVTQMGTQFKSAILEEQTANAIREWHAGVKQKRKKKQVMSPSVSSYPSPISTTNRTMDSPDDFYSNNRFTSPDFSSHHNRTPTFAEIVAVSSQSEIIEYGQEIVPSTALQIDHMPKNQT
ncbi:hypothetical protein GH714_014098 [Hevea brasiliensis]|uniref:MLO-like protein n=1 Tax=Hevea brasiliensis TaxID=3981 RepID=A0A6A6LJB4_HEVBR|nr:hypothetical protein GH714_014098 [Hevea brasiliensis]